MKDTRIWLPLNKWDPCLANCLETTCQTWRKSSIKTRKKVKEILKESRFSLTPKTSAQEFFSVLTAHPKFELTRAKNRQFLYDEFMGKLEREEKKKEKDAERKKKKAYSRFMDFLESKKISAFAKWSEVRESLVEHSAFQKMSNDEERQAVFAEYISRKKEDMSSSDEEGRIRSPGSPGDDKKQKKRKHKHARKGSDGEDKRKKKSKRSPSKDKKGPVDYSSSEEEGERKDKP